MKIINLLPKDKQRELYFEIIFRSLVIFVEISMVTFALVFVGQVATKIYIQRQHRVLDAEIEQLKSQSNREENAALKKRIGVINNEITDFKTLADTTPTWSKIMRAFAAQMPEGLTVSSFQGDLPKKRIDIRGVGPTREAIIELYNHISQDKDEFYDIDYPLENVQRPNNVPFHFTFYVKDKLLSVVPAKPAAK